MPTDEATSRPPNGGIIRSLKDDAIRLLNARFTGIVVAGIIGVWLVSAILQQLGYGATADSLGRIAELAFLSYVIKKAYQANGAK